ncbi:MAG: hypothetical protein GEU80_10555 [Dehalococcoidia bacterium]|nr:hypothetical protein [Dehalococcoidia bacterium]
MDTGQVHHDARAAPTPGSCPDRVTSDYTTGGIVLALQWTPQRTILFAARTAVTVAVATGAGVLLAACGLAAFGTAGSAPTQPWDEALNLLGAAAFVFASGTALAVGLGFLLRTMAGALITVFLLMLVLPLLLAAFRGWISTLGAALPGSGAAFLLVGEPSSMTTASSVVVLPAWAGGILLLGWLRLTRDDANR